MKKIKTGDIKKLVGRNTYTTWIEMLKELVPHGRTHRMSVVVAAMIQYMLSKSDEDSKNPVSQALTQASEDYGSEEAYTPIIGIIEKLFQDAGVKFKRTNSKGRGYSIAESAAEEFFAFKRVPGPVT